MLAELAEHDRRWDEWVGVVEHLLRDAGRVPADLDVTPQRVVELDQLARTAGACWRFDGDQDVDGWSVAQLYGQFVAGLTPAQALADVL